VPLEEARARYRRALTWLDRALEHGRQRLTSEHPGNLYTTMGLVHKAWGERERRQGDEAQGQQHKREALECLRKGYEKKDNNVFAAFGLAKYLVDWSRELLEAGSAARPAEVGAYLAEAIDLLQLQPEEYFRGEWQEVFQRTVELLQTDEAKRVISRLTDNRDELGFALQAMVELGNEIPLWPVRRPMETPIKGAPGEEQLPEAETRLRVVRAAELLREAEQLSPRKPSELADLLRYALFSALLDPNGEPEYDR
jgi:hypothetical protein